MTHLSLFSGIGGLDIAAEWAGFQTVGQCEWADYPTKVLEKHWPDVLRWRDIHTLTGVSFYERTGLRTVDIISGGFPCQPFSVAGKQKGKGDERYLWPEMLRVIRELAPRWVIGENVPGILRIAGKTVCEELEREGYAVTVFNYEAAAVGAPHRRERIFFVANSCVSGRCAGSNNKSKRHLQKDEEWNAEENQSQRDGWLYRSGKIGAIMADANIDGRLRDGQLPEIGCHADQINLAFAESADVSNPQSIGLQGKRSNGEQVADTRREKRKLEGLCAERDVCYATSKGFSDGPDIPLGRSGEKSESQRSDWWAVEPDVGRVAHGVPNRVDRLKCLGNAVVPQQAYPIFRAIADIENGGMTYQ